MSNISSYNGIDDRKTLFRQNLNAATVPAEVSLVEWGECTSHTLDPLLALVGGETPIPSGS